MSLPSASRYVIIGAGIHGLSTAWTLGSMMKARGEDPEGQILVIDKGVVGSGASGIACGVVRNNYFQPAMRELMAHSVDVWESDPEAFAYHGVGYMQISPDSMIEGVRTIWEQQQAIGYDSSLIEGEAASRSYMRDLFHDWRAEGITSVLHEKRGGYANNLASLMGLRKKAVAAGARIIEGVEVTGFGFDQQSNAITSVETTKGKLDCDEVVIAVGPWIRNIWRMLDQPETIQIAEGQSNKTRTAPMWHFWQLEEGVLEVDPGFLKTNDGEMPPVMHVDTDAPLHSVTTGKLITDKMWGIYYKPDFHFNGIQGGAMPYAIDLPAEEVAIDPYGPASQQFVASKDFQDMWTSALSFCHARFENCAARYRNEKSGGIGCFTPDSFPVFDRIRQNCFIIADSNHGYKMIGVGKLVAEELLGQKSALLEPFSLSRFGSGKMHPVSSSPFPWS